MKQRSLLVIFLGIILIGVAIYAVISRGYFPALLVNGEIITDRQYEQSVSAVINYYEVAGKTYQGINIEEVLKNKGEVRKLALEQLIEATLINQGLKERLGGNLDAVVQNKLGDLEHNQNLEKAVSAIYGMGFDDFINLFMRPVAERELLDGKLLLEKTDMATWLKNAKLQARVTLLLPGYSWQNGEVKIN
ncbi:MAG: SurA N-terminal domain-containing protein [bacterium]|nr:SurA N-terminal domain-containing protein [bacterium]